MCVWCISVVLLLLYVGTDKKKREKMFVWQWAEINESNVHAVLLHSVTALSLLHFCVIGSIFLFCLSFCLPSSPVGPAVKCVSLGYVHAKTIMITCNS